ncbi:uncharacterized protein LOC100210554 isoform X1 [Hydra vulgaris]|uniref:uncharacterized protein LOC100210554 isoform X1 n=1 Tax=Hydra vulgaris TaxID=6087 RepID=UPI001F5F1C74|nr:uncharacterized protein LOC100210554 isoform X1 [Hydra vulgaris]
MSVNETNKKMARMKLPGASSPGKDKLETVCKSEAHYDESVNPMVISKDDYVALFGNSSSEEDNDTKNGYCNNKIKDEPFSKNDHTEIDVSIPVKKKYVLEPKTRSSSRKVQNSSLEVDNPYKKNYFSYRKDRKRLKVDLDKDIVRNVKTIKSFETSRKLTAVNKTVKFLLEKAHKHTAHLPQRRRKKNTDQNFIYYEKKYIKNTVEETELCTKSAFIESTGKTKPSYSEKKKVRMKYVVSCCSNQSSQNSFSPQKYVTPYSSLQASHNGSPPKKRIKIKNSSPQKLFTKQMSEESRTLTEKSILHSSPKVLLNNFMDIFDNKSCLLDEELKSSKNDDFIKLCSEEADNNPYIQKVSNRQNVFLKKIKCDDQEKHDTDKRLYINQTRRIKKSFPPSVFWKNHTGNIRLKAINISGKLHFTDFSNRLVTFCGNCSNCKKTEDCMKCKHCKNLKGYAMRYLPCYNRRCINPIIGKQIVINKKLSKRIPGSTEKYLTKLNVPPRIPQVTQIEIPEQNVEENNITVSNLSPTSSMQHTFTSGDSTCHSFVVENKNKLCKPLCKDIFNSNEVFTCSSIKPKLRSTMNEITHSFNEHLPRIEYSLDNLIKIPWPNDNKEDAAWVAGHHLCLTTAVDLNIRNLCFLCGSAGKEHMIFCSLCCEPFHTFCLDVEPVFKKNWYCDRCKYCTVCGMKESLLMCDICHDCYHAECLGPFYQCETEGEDEIWVCGKCVKCVKCNRRTPGDNKSSRWMQNFTMCEKCDFNWKKGNYCPVCLVLYNDDDDALKMMFCTKCEAWVHMECEGITEDDYEILADLPDDVPYLCKLCTGNNKESQKWFIATRTELKNGFLKVYSSVMLNKDYKALCKVFGENSVMVSGFDTMLDSIQSSKVKDVHEFKNMFLKIINELKILVKEMQVVDVFDCYIFKQVNKLFVQYLKYLNDVFPWHLADKSIMSNTEYPVVIKSNSVNYECTPYISNYGDHTYSVASKLEENYKDTKDLKDSSITDLRRCMFCGVYGDGELCGAGRLLYSGDNEWVHVNCALWSAEVYEDEEGRLKHVYEAIKRGNKIKCDLCDQLGASVGCCYQKCPKSYHFICAKQNQVIFLDDKKIYCNAHSNKANKNLILREDQFVVSRRVLVDLARFKSLKRVQRGIDPKDIKVYCGGFSLHNLGSLSDQSDLQRVLVPVSYKVTKIFWSTTNPKHRCKYTCEVHSLNNPTEKFVKTDSNIFKDDNMTFYHDNAEWQYLKKYCCCGTNFNDNEFLTGFLHKENCVLKKYYKYYTQEELLSCLKKTLELPITKLYTHKDHNFYSITNPQTQESFKESYNPSEQTQEHNEQQNIYPCIKDSYVQEHISPTHLLYQSGSSSSSFCISSSDFISDLSSTSTLSATSPMFFQNDCYSCGEETLLIPKNESLETTDYTSIKNQSLSRQISEEIERRIHQTSLNEKTSIEYNFFQKSDTATKHFFNNSTNSYISSTLPPYLIESNINTNLLDINNLNKNNYALKCDVSLCESFLYDQNIVNKLNNEDLKTYDALLHHLHEHTPAYTGIEKCIEKSSTIDDASEHNSSFNCFSVTERLQHAEYENNKIQKINTNKSSKSNCYEYSQIYFSDSPQLQQSCISVSLQKDCVPALSSLQQVKHKKRIKMAADIEVSPKKQILSCIPKGFNYHEERFVDNLVVCNDGMLSQPTDYNPEIIKETNASLTHAVSIPLRFTEMKDRKESSTTKQKDIQKCYKRNYREALKKLLDNKKYEKIRKSKTQLMFVLKNEEGWFKESNSLEEIWKELLFEINDKRLDFDIPPINIESTDPYDFIGISKDFICYLVEQLSGGHKCRTYKFQYHLPCVGKEDQKTSMNPTGCARSEIFFSKAEKDMFAWLASPYRKPPKSCANDTEEDVVFGPQELPVAMKYRLLKNLAKDNVGVYRSKIQGRGLFCKKTIEAGEMIIEYSGEKIRSSLTDRREKYYEKKGYGCYMFRIDDTDVVDATTKGNAARFINHSCEPNCFSRIISIDGCKKIIIYAQKRVTVGEELTYDYKFAIEDDKLPCFCGAKKCRKYLN